MKTQYELFPNLPAVRNPAGWWAKYRAYLKSDEWKEVSRETKRIARYRCKRCGSRDHLECHHVSYENVRRETPGVDTMCVCKGCHIYIHAHPIIRADNDNTPLAANDNTPMF